MAEEKVKHKEPSFLKSFTAGGVGGLALVCTGHPLDTIKVRLQTMPQPAPGEAPMFTGTFDCARATVRKEGFRGLYRGMSAPLVGITPLYAVCFLGYSVGKHMQLKDPTDTLSLPQHFVAGMVAGVFTTAIMAPGERIKCLMQIQQGSKDKVKYSSSWDCARQLYRQGGITNLYRGTMATLLRDVPASAVYFMTYEWLLLSLTPEGQSHHDLSPLRVLFAGGMAGVFNWLVCIPQDTVKSRYQTASEGRYPHGIRSVFKELIREEGFLALYRGLTPVLLRAFPANAACFLGYETAMKVLDYLFPSL